MPAATSTLGEPFRRPSPPTVALVPALVRGFNVLLVDDDDHHRTPLLRALREQGHNVLDAADGVSGEKLCRESKLEIDALVACVEMKRMHGFELARRAVRMRPDVRVLLMERHFAEPEDAEPEQDHRAYEGGYAVIEEPFTPRELCRRLTGLLGSPRNDACGRSELDAEDVAYWGRTESSESVSGTKTHAPRRSIHGTE